MVNRSATPGSTQTSHPQIVAASRPESQKNNVRTLADYRPDETPRVSTGSAEIDRVLGGGLVAGEVVLVGGDPGVGKCLGRGTPVIMFDGRVVSVEEVQRGDRLMGPDGRPRVVQTTTSGTSELYRIDPIKGEPWICNGPHMLALVHSVTDEIIVISVDEWLTKAPQSRLRVKSKLFSVGVEKFGGHGEKLPIDPYFLGLWFGDGTKEIRDGKLAHVVITKPDPEVRSACVEMASVWGLHVSEWANSSGCPSFSISGTKGLQNPLLDAMRELLGDALTMPASYTRAARRDRLSFLAGLIDSDGDLSHGCFSVTQKREDWAREIWWMARSLGFCATITPRKGRYKRPDGTIFEGDYWRVIVSGDTEMIPTRIPRKQAHAREQIKEATRTGFSVESIGPGEYFGFELDGDSLFLLGDFTVTHNSSILAQIQARMVAASDLGTGFYGSGEESYDQIARRAERLGVRSPRVHVLHTSDIDEVVNAAASSPRVLAVFDSAQVFRHAESRGATGSPSQVKACCERIVAYARASGTPCVIVCHITKDGDLAGPKTLEHLVDCVVQIELASDGIRRIVSTAKNRHGDTSEIGVLEMTTGGLVDAPHDDQAALLERATGRPGSAVACVYTGARALCVEVQALCAFPRGEAGGKLTCVGIDPKRATTLLAVLAEHAGIDALNTRDVFLSVAGGINLRDPSADAAVALAIASSYRKIALDPRTIAIGEVGLAGELRSAPGARQRMIEAIRAGFTRLIVAPGTAIPSPSDLGVSPGSPGTDLVILRAAAIEDAIALAVPEPQSIGKPEADLPQVYPAGDTNAS